MKVVDKGTSKNKDVWIKLWKLKEIIHCKTDIEIPAQIEVINVTEIGDKTFQGNATLTSVFLPDTVTEIGSSAFNGCLSLKSINLSASLKSIGSRAFYQCGAFDLYWKHQFL